MLANFSIACTGWKVYKNITLDLRMSEQEFLKELEDKLWRTANKLLPSLDAAVYKHVVLG